MEKHTPEKQDQTGQGQTESAHFSPAPFVTRPGKKVLLPNGSVGSSTATLVTLLPAEPNRILLPEEGKRNLATGLLLAWVGSFGTLLLQLGISFLTTVLPYDSVIHPQMYARAKDAYIRNDLAETIRLLEPARKAPKQNPSAAFLLGKAYFFRSNYSEAEGIWKSLLEKVPDHPETLKWLARLYLSQGKGEAAEQLCYRILARDSENPEGLFLLGKARLSKGDTRRALEYLEKAKASLRRLAEVPLELADLYRQFGLHTRSREELELTLHLLGKESSLYRTVEGSLKKLEGP